MSLQKEPILFDPFPGIGYRRGVAEEDEMYGISDIVYSTTEIKTVHEWSSIQPGTEGLIIDVVCTPVRNKKFYLYVVAFERGKSTICGVARSDQLSKKKLKNGPCLH